MKKAGNLFFSLLALSAVGGLSACGPMNHRPADAGGGADSTGGQKQLDSGAIGGLPIHGSQKGHFLVRAAIKAEVASTDGALPHAKVGDNVYSLRFVQAENLGALSKDAQVTVQYQRLNSHYPKKFDATVQRQEDGSYTAGVTFKKPGNWEVSIHVVDSALQDDYVFQITLE